MRAGLLIAVLLTGAGANGFAQTDFRDKPASGTQVELLTDAHFENGFNLLGTRSIESGGQVFEVLNYGRSGGAAPAWRLAQWGTRHSLKGANVEVLQSGVFRYSNIAKAVTADTVRGELTLAAYASQEYAGPRKANEEWPHLLVEQYFRKRPLLKDLDELRFKSKVRLSHFTDRMTSDTFDPGLHAAQLQVYLMVQNCDTSSSVYGDYFWFGLPLFDNRKEMSPESGHKDGGKEDTTHKFIYILPAAQLLTKGLGGGEWASIDVNLLPHISRGESLARSAGFLTGTAHDQLGVTSINIGWELPGTFDVEAKIKDLELVAEQLN